MLNDEFERNTASGWGNWWSGFNWEETRAGVDRESRARILLLGLAHAGKSTLFNRLCGWNVSPPASQPAENGRGGQREDFGLFCLVDLPQELEGGNGAGEDAPGVEPDPIALADEGDLLVYVLDGSLGVRAADYRWIGRLRRMGVPLLVTLNKCDLAGEATIARLPDIEGRLATSVLPISALKGTNVLERLVPRMMDACPALAVPLGRELRSFRRQAAARLIRQAALFNGLIALEPVPLLDVPLQMVTLVGLVLRIAAVYGQPPSDTQRREVLAAIAGGLAGRYATQQAVKLVPIVGWVASGLIGASATWLLGRAAVAYFEAGGDAALAAGWERTRERVQQSWSPVRGAWQVLTGSRRRWKASIGRRWRARPRLQVGVVRPEPEDLDEEGQA
jgi:uncharacterized protein (DUF697 family)